MTAPLTGPQVLLVVALDLREPFHESDLLLAAWKRDPQRFGLRRYESQWPDLNRCRAALCHKRGPVDKGHLVRADKPLTYKLTPGGRAEAKAIAAGERNGKLLRTLRLPPEIEAEIGRMLGSRAWRMFLTGQPISFRDAMLFWGTSRDENGGHVAAALGLVEKCLRDADDYRTSEGLQFGDGRIVSDKELGRLKTCDAAMRNAFRRELERL